MCPHLCSRSLQNRRLNISYTGQKQKQNRDLGQPGKCVGAGTATYLTRRRRQVGSDDSWSRRGAGFRPRLHAQSELAASVRVLGQPESCRRRFSHDSAMPNKAVRSRQGSVEQRKGERSTYLSKAIYLVLESCLDTLGGGALVDTDNSIPGNGLWLNHSPCDRSSPLHTRQVRQWKDLAEGGGGGKITMASKEKS